uniref:Establishment of sister chromatid cohesion N-acetyltransferase 2 n=1 Tax=Sphenodon punctatus TaxID=8508 RepID=A0A8D0GSZ9_SPHPU
MATRTPRKRKRMKKLLLNFADDWSPVKTFPTQTKWASSSSDEDKENQDSPLKSSPSRKLDSSPVQTATVPMEAHREPPRKMSPKSGSPYKAVVSTMSFYSKGKSYLTPLERKLVNEIHPLGQRNSDGNLPSASRTDTPQVEVKPVGNTDSKAPKRRRDPRQTKTQPRNSKKAKMEMAPVAPALGKEHSSLTVEKKTEAPFRVLTMKVKPVLKLQVGAAFFSTGKRFHAASKKELPSPVAPPPISRPAAKGDQPREAAAPGPPDVVYSLFSPSVTNRKRYVVSSHAPLAQCLGKLNLKGKKRHQDAGQKHFCPVMCKACGMIYSAANPEDEAQHIQHHQRFLEGIKFVGWKKEHVVEKFWDGKIILVRPNDPKYATKKAEEVRELVDHELGFKQVVLSCPAKTKTYLFVYDKKIVGCLVAEQIKQAFRVLSEPCPPVSPNQNALEHHRAWRCSTKPEPAICGVSRIWVLSLMRRKGIARRLVDVVRNTFIFGCYLSTEEIAFSDPTPDGKLFATKYCQTPNFLVYNFIKASSEHAHMC